MTKPFRIIGLYEGAFHNEVLESYVHHFLPLADEIYIFSDPFQWEQAVSWRDNYTLHWFIKKKDDNHADFVKAHHHPMQKCEWLIVTSLPSSSDFLKNIIFPCPAWLVIHNIHYFFSPGFNNLYISQRWLKDIVKIGRFFITGQFRRNTRILNKFSNIIFATDVMRQYFLENFPKTRFHNPAVIPFISLHAATEIDKDKVFTIVVPGSISQEIRDYNIFTYIIPEILKNSERPFRLSFLGKQKDSSCDQIIRFLEKLQHEKFTFDYGKDFIPQPLFEHKMRSAHLIVSTLQEITRYDAKCEFFGFSTESGQIADIVKYGLPAIIPAFYPIPAVLEPRINTYHSPSVLVNQILSHLEGHTNHRITDLPSYSPRSVGQMILQQWESNRSKK